MNLIAKSLFAGLLLCVLEDVHARVPAKDFAKRAQGHGESGRSEATASPSSGSLAPRSFTQSVERGAVGSAPVTRNKVSLSPKFFSEECLEKVAAYLAKDQDSSRFGETPNFPGFWFHYIVSKDRDIERLSRAEVDKNYRAELYQERTPSTRLIRHTIRELVEERQNAWMLLPDLRYSESTSVPANVRAYWAPYLLQAIEEGCSQRDQLKLGHARVLSTMLNEPSKSADPMRKRQYANMLTGQELITDAASLFSKAFEECAHSLRRCQSTCEKGMESLSNGIFDIDFDEIEKFVTFTLEPIRESWNVLQKTFDSKAESFEQVNLARLKGDKRLCRSMGSSSYQGSLLQATLMEVAKAYELIESIKKFPARNQAMIEDIHRLQWVALADFHKWKESQSID